MGVDRWALRLESKDSLSDSAIAPMTEKSVFHSRKPQVFAQGVSRVALAKQAPALQLRGDQLHEILDGSRQMGKQYIEAIGGVLLVPGRQFINDLPWRAVPSTVQGLIDPEKQAPAGQSFAK